MVHERRRIVGVETVRPGWRAVYRCPSGIGAREIAAWALVERYERGVAHGVDRVGLVVEEDRIAFADQVTDSGDRFCGYAAPGVALQSLQVTERSNGSDRRYADLREGSLASSWFG